MPHDENAAPEGTEKPRRLRKLLLGGAAAIALGILANAAWELATKPLLRGLANVVTLGSRRMGDSMYALAVHDPTLLSGPFVLLLCAAVPLSMLLPFVALATLRRPESQRRLASLKWEPTALSAAALVSLAFLVLVGARSVMLTYSAAIWRTFHENIERCAPYLDDAKERQLRAEFVVVKSKKNFDVVQARIRVLSDGKCEVAEPK